MSGRGRSRFRRGGGVTLDGGLRCFRRDQYLPPRTSGRAVRKPLFASRIFSAPEQSEARFSFLAAVFMFFRPVRRFARLEKKPERWVVVTNATSPVDGTMLFDNVVFRSGAFNFSVCATPPPTTRNNRAWQRKGVPCPSRSFYANLFPDFVRGTGDFFLLFPGNFFWGLKDLLPRGAGFASAPLEFRACSS